MAPRRLPRVLIVVPYAAAVLAAWVGYRQFGPLPSGVPLNRLAWQRAFGERGLALPPNGPREGYWGRFKPRAIADPELGWREVLFRLPGRVDIDALGFQVVGEPSAPRHMLIVGGSVAWGAYASSLGKTYFSLIAERLTANRLPVRISILDVQGRTVAELCNKNLSAGDHRFSWNAENTPKGIYIARIKTGNGVINKKLVKK